MTVLRRKVRRKVRAKPRARRAVAPIQKRRRIGGVPEGYTRRSSGLLVPAEATKLVEPSKLQKGLRDAHRAIGDLLAELAKSIGGDYAVTEIELAASFNADGKFLGLGVGGAATVTVRLGPP
jgi:hypothetical protein